MAKKKEGKCVTRQAGKQGQKKGSGWGDEVTEGGRAGVGTNKLTNKRELLTVAR